MRETLTDLPPLSVVLPDAPRPKRRVLALDQPWRQVLALAVPFWLGVSAVRLASFELTVMRQDGITLFPWWIRVGQHTIVLLVAILCYRRALDIGWPRAAAARWLDALRHLALGLVVAVCARPVLLTIGFPFMAQIEPMPGVPPAPPWTFGRYLAENLQGYGMRLWVSSALDFLMSYAFGLALLVGVRNTLALRDAEIERTTLQNAWMQSRLQALRMQLNPHFLFNALNTVATLLESQPARARNLTVNLSHLLRGALDAGTREWTTLESEADFATLYLAIQAARFESRLSYDVSLEPDTQAVAVPSMILQPLVENSVVHGVADDRDRLHVWIHARRAQAGGVIEIEIGNQTTGALGPPPAREGVGLANTRARVAICYGVRASVEQRRRDASTFVVLLRLPVDAGPRT